MKEPSHVSVNELYFILTHLELYWIPAIICGIIFTPIIYYILIWVDHES